MRVLSSSQYKYTTFFAEIQIPLTFRNTLATVKMRRFAADEGWRVLYYEERMEGRAVLALLVAMAAALLVFQQFVRTDVAVAFAEHNEVGAARLSFEGEGEGRTLACGLCYGLAADVRHLYLCAWG